MSEAESNTGEMVEEGLKLYSQGKLDEALARWNAVLELNPDHERAIEYIKYVEENRAALEESFLTAGTLETTEGEGEGEGESEADEGQGEGEEGTVQPSERSRSEVVVAELPPTDLTSPQLDTDPIETTARMDVEELKARIDATKVRLAGRAKRDHRTPSTLLPAVKVDGEAPHLELVKGESQEEATGFEPLEETPVGVEMPQPSRAVPEEPTQPEAGPATEAAPPASVDPSITQPALGAADDAERVASMLSGATQLFEQETYEGSLWLCERILSMEPDNEEAKELLGKNQLVLLKQYEEAIGDIEQVPVVQIPQHEILWHKLDHRAGFLLSRIDGQLSFQDVIDVSGMSHFDASRILAQLQSMGVIGSRK